jgi:hypothetical protein
MFRPKVDNSNLFVCGFAAGASQRLIRRLRLEASTPERKCAFKRYRSKVPMLLKRAPIKFWLNFGATALLVGNLTMASRSMGDAEGIG